MVKSFLSKIGIKGRIFSFSTVSEDLCGSAAARVPRRNQKYIEVEVLEKFVERMLSRRRAMIAGRRNIIGFEELFLSRKPFMRRMVRRSAKRRNPIRPFSERIER